MIKVPQLLIVSIFLLSTAISTAQKQAKTDNVPVKESIDKKVMAEEVKNAMIHAWDGYRKYAWGMDALKPISKTGENWYPESLLMTPVDAIDALLILGLKEQASEAKELILSKLDFDKDMDIQNFEVSIRLLGGLLSAYELDGDKKFLDLASDLGSRLINAFDSPTGMPYRYINLKTGVKHGEISNPAEIGTYLVEFGILSHHTGEPRYYETAKKAMKSLYAKCSTLGLPGSTINIETGEWVSTEAHISGGIDSYYEYLLKAAILFHDEELMEMWKSSYEAVDKYLADRRDGMLWYRHVDMNNGVVASTHFGSLDAFFVGSLVLSGDLQNAAALQESNFKMWMLQGIEPEEIDYSSMKIVYDGYALRPENIEGAYYLYKATGDEKYLQMGRDMFRNLVKYCKNDAGFCALKSVVTKEKEDSMESFFLAETLKYAYLLFADSEMVPFSKVIFGTEAHPYKRF